MMIPAAPASLSSALNAPETAPAPAEVPSQSVSLEIDLAETDLVAASASLESATAAQRLRHLSEIGLALSAEHDSRRLLELILSASRELTSADGGTLYIVEKDASGQKSLFFRASQNDSITVDTNFSVAVSPSSLAGYAALSGEILRMDDVYHLDQSAPYKFNPSFDADHGYRTQSVLVVPLKNHNGEVIGVLQLINRKRRREVLLQSPQIVESEVIPFDDEMTELAAILASQASVALNNTLLLREIEELFESFVVAASSAIEDRDPGTSGHSRRVTQLTLGLARAVDEVTSGPFAATHFSPAQMRELRYATLLHDFGKIGVRENVLTKSHKIEPTRFEALQTRILALRGQIEAEGTRKCLEIALQEKAPIAGLENEKIGRLSAIEAQTRAQVARLDADAQILVRLNDPSLDTEADEFWSQAMEALDRLSSLCFEGMEGQSLPLLQPGEADALRVRRGTLTPDEFLQIQAHAQMSFEFLKQIPWTGALQNVPAIARAHHERGDGSGYPQALRAGQIPLGAKLMAIADVYDALTASDRPYKRAMSPKNALQILEVEAKAGKLDAAALQIFIEAEIWKLAGESSAS
ncbi:metal dependent phosphohydrolase [Abditibacterium utsteinense]|uniref:Metal dependent phosphohydrolase n=1 Tax=Abditibacterium utsteinense TaxID=1960156 RepID=A0A2S8SRG4_9BACT|nr:HD domain-containing phosphohydrolase [Abditibacterium utsteinense]PQV63375.1 metal dependent phosphohydrolase [Abditibacterium utsteinense]